LAEKEVSIETVLGSVEDGGRVVNESEDVVVRDLVEGAKGGERR